MRDQVVPMLLDPACARSEWHIEILRGVQKSAAATQRAVLVADHASELIEARQQLCDPVIVAGFEQESLSETVSELEAAGMRIILAGIDADELSAPVSCVTHSRSRQTIQLIRYLQACGREHIALVGIGQHSLNDLVKVSAAKQFTAHQPRPITNGDVFKWSECFEDCLDAFLPVCDRYDAVLCPSDYIALLLLNRLKAADVPVPDRLYIASFANLAIGRFCRPSITTITMDYSAIGRYAFSIWQQLQTLTDVNLVSKIVAPSRLLIRGTTAYQNPPVLSGVTTLVGSSQKDLFYHDPTLKEMMRLESYFSRRDGLDLRVIECLLNGRSYEDITDKLYISSSALHYRLGKLYHDLDCQTRKEFVQKLHGIYDKFSCDEEMQD